MTREEAIKIINCYDIGFYDLSGAKIPADKLADAFDMAIEALSAEAVQVVRCKDCKWWNSGTKGCKRNPCVEPWFESDSCSYGERQCNYFGERREE